MADCTTKSHLGAIKKVRNKNYTRDESSPSPLQQNGSRREVEHSKARSRNRSRRRKGDMDGSDRNHLQNTGIPVNSSTLPSGVQRTARLSAREPPGFGAISNSNQRQRSTSATELYEDSRKKNGNTIMHQNRQDYRRSSSSTRWTSGDPPMSQHRVWKRSDGDQKHNVASNSKTNSNATTAMSSKDTTLESALRMAALLCNKNPMSESALNLARETAFMSRLTQYISDLPENKDTDIPDLLSNITIFCKTILKVMPEQVFQKVSNVVSQLQRTISILETHHNLHLDEKLQESFHELEVQTYMFTSRWEERKLKVNNATVKIRNVLDFREFSPFPTSDDLLANELAGSNSNTEKSKYNITERYLSELFFKLRKESIVQSLNSSVSDYLNRAVVLNNDNVGRVGNVTFYKNVSILHPTVAKGRVGVLVQFDPNVRSEQMNFLSERFIFGSLLLFTVDDFDTIIIGTVLERTKEDLKNGYVVVQLYAQISVIQYDIFSLKFTMAETDVHFMPIVDVLRALQLKGNGTLPFSQYIVSRKKRFPSDCSILQDEFSYLSLDPFQMQCLKLSLTNDLVLAHGFPGTGKTYLAVKVAEVLFKSSDRSPILIMCKSSNLLSKLLRGVLRFTDNLVYVGGHCHDEQLTGLTLESKLSKCQRQEIRQLKARSLFNITTFQRIVKHIKVLLRKEGVISWSNLKQLGQFGEKYQRCFSHPKFDEETMFYSWLICEVPFVNQKTIIHKRTKFMVADSKLEASSLKLEVAMNLDDNDRRWSETAHEIDSTKDASECHIRYIESISNLEEEKATIKKAIKKLQDNWTEHDETNTKERDDLRNANRNVAVKLSRFTKCLLECLSETKTNYHLLQERDLWSLTPSDRWRLYRLWLVCIRQYLENQLKSWQQQIIKERETIEILENLEHIVILKEARIIGITVHKAVTLRNVLQAVKPKRVIVVEADEIPEAHLIAALPNSSQRLLLIGTEQPPGTATESLLGRLLTEGMLVQRLSAQHRMRPEIARLSTPTLVSPDTAESSPQVGGIATCTYFVTHSINPEQDGSSLHEVNFLLALCRHLLHQGYRSRDILVLTFCGPQTLLMLQERSKFKSLKGVIVNMVDNCRGVESEIVLLSLAGKSTSTTNAKLMVRLALTRARVGLYIIGHSNILADDKDPWHGVHAIFKSHNSVGDSLQLGCQTHPEQLTAVRKASDFELVSEGGCSQPCGVSLLCGHTCQKSCHMVDLEHTVYRCTQRCGRVRCPQAHGCNLPCWKDCGPCCEPMLRNLSCGHRVTLPCHQDVKTYKCKVSCHALGQSGKDS